jgi:hypothetical protein
VLWYPGDHALEIPGPILVSPEGASDTLPAVAATVRVFSVLPPGADRSSLAPRPAEPPVRQAAPSILPVVVLEVLAMLVAGFAALGWAWRTRRRRAAIVPPRPAPLKLETSLTVWAELGELRAALDGWAHLIEAGVAGREVTPRAAAWLAAAERAGFRGQADTAELERLIDAVKSLRAAPGEPVGC